MHATTAPTPAPASNPRSPLLINRQFTLLWAGQAISTLGDMVFATTLALWIVANLAQGRAWAPLAVSGVLAAAALPDILVGPFAGVFVDRWDRRRTMLTMDAARAALIALLAVPTGLLPLPFLPGARPPMIVALGAVYLAAFLSSVCAQFFGPARMAAIADVVAEPERARATGLIQASASLGTIMAPPIAAAVYFAAGPGPALAFNAISFLASFLAVRALRLPPGQGQASGAAGFWREFAEGITYFVGNRVLRTVLITAVIVMLGGGALNALDIFFLGRNLHAPLHLYGVLSACGGVGVLAGSLLAGLYAQRLGLERAFWLSMVALGALIALYARLTSFAPALVVLFVVGVPSATVNVCVGPLMLNATPRALLGRVMAVLQPAISLASLLSMAAAGYLASGALRGFHARWLGIRWGPYDTIFTATALLLLAGGAYAARNLRPATAQPAIHATRVSNLEITIDKIESEAHTMVMD